MASNPVTKLTEEQYLALDRAAEIRSEFLDGEMVAMSGVSMVHARLQWNISTGLDAHLRDHGCEGFGSDFRVRVSSRMYAYPDVTVVCGKPVLADDRQDILLNPVVLFEVLSPSTEKYDRGVKFQHYRTIESLNEYILVAQEQVLVEQYIRQSDNTWSLRDFQNLDNDLKIDAIGVTLSLQRIYRGVELPSG
ncbi:MAG TPA: Uma2 family endonuclease [Bryobacteraceae bacterium]|nr:Uma2 family endonuclease [Bryobacteraceae bacterium]